MTPGSTPKRATNVEPKWKALLDRIRERDGEALKRSTTRRRECCIPWHIGC